MTEGMVAVVKGLRDCGLAVALMGDDGKTYTLVPNAAEGPGKGIKQPQYFDAGAQVNEARYSTVYMTQHCNMAPTSPPALYPEFPPQRPDVHPGHGNFQVGGNGSGEAGYTPVKSSSYRGAMCWNDRGSVCSPRHSRDPDAFASSLRRYPVASSPERSEELFERLVNYSQGRNFPRSPTRTQSPPNRSYETITPPSYPDTGARVSRQGMYEPDRRQRAPEDYPTRDRRWPETESYMKSTFSRNNDARFVRDVSKRLKESIKSMSSYDNYSVDVETQVASDMFSPRVAVANVGAPTKRFRSVGVPLSAIPSCQLSEQTETKHACSSAQPLPPISSPKSVQTSTSSVVPSESNGRLSKGSKSSNGFSIDEGLKDEILKWLEDNTDPKLKKLQDTVIKKLSKRYKKMSMSNSKKFSVKSEEKKYHEHDDKNIIDGIIDKLIRMHLRYCEAVDSAEMIKATLSDQSFEHTNKVLTNEASLKKRDFSRTLKKEQVYDAFRHKIKQWSFKKPKAYRKQSFRIDILNLLHDAPIDFHGLNKMVYLNTLAEAFETKLNNAPIEHKNTTNHYEEDPEPSRCLYKVQKNPFQPTIKQLKIRVADSLTEFINKIKVKLQFESVEEIIQDLTKVLLDAIIRLNFSDENFATGIATLIKNVTLFPVNEATKFASPCTGHIKNIFNGYGIVGSRPETYVVLQSASLNHPSFIVSDNSNVEIKSSSSDKEEKIELKIYKRQLFKQIDEWVRSLSIPLARNKEFRKYLVNDLVDDILDRCKYLELNKDCVYKTDESEHLKYQIFKWINKIVGDRNKEAVKHAAELLERIRLIKKPGTTSHNQQNIELSKDTTKAGSSQKTSGKKKLSVDDDGNINLACSKSMISSNTNTCLSDGEDPDQKIQMPAYKNTQTDWYDYSERYNEKMADGYLSDTELSSNIWRDVHDIMIRTQTVNTSTQTVFPVFIDQGFQTNEEQVPPVSIARISDPNSDCCKPLSSSLKPLSPGPNSPAIPSLRQINDEFDDFLRDWVKDIPIRTNNPEEEAVADKARVGFFHGVWEAIISAKSQPIVILNRFYFEDVLGDAIDELFDCLPQTPELKDKRYMLRAKLIEKIVETNELAKELHTPASFKQEVAELLAARLRTVKVENEDPAQLNEEMHIQCIVEDFILASAYKNEDKLKETAYRYKLKKKVESLINEAKKAHGQGFRNQKETLSLQDIVDMLRKVPLPSDATLKEEADEIILGHEIDQWFADLPIVKHDTSQERLLRRRYKDALTIKLHELEKDKNFAECYDEPEFKHEISIFLQKMPLEKDESLNINFMVSELANRIKNRDRPGHRKKSVAFEEGGLECCRMRPRQDNSGGTDIGGVEDNYRGQENSRRQDDQGQHSGHGQYSGQGQLFDEDDYNVFHKEKPANSTMINPPSEPQRYNNGIVPDYRKWGIDSHQSQNWYSFDSAGKPQLSKEPPKDHFTYVPGQFQERRLGGKFGDDAQNRSANMQQSIPRYPRYVGRDSADATRHGPPIRNYFDNSGKYIPAPDDQNQPKPAPQKTNRSPNHDLALQGPEDFDANLESPFPAGNRPIDKPSFRQVTSDKSAWQEQPEDEFISLLHDSRPQLQSQHGTQIKPYDLPPYEVQDGEFAPEGTRLPERPGQQSGNLSTYNPEPGNSRRTPNYLDGGFIKSRLDTDQDQSHPQNVSVPQSVQPPISPGSHRIQGLIKSNAFPEERPQLRTYIKITEPIENSQPTSSQRPDEQDPRFLAPTPPQTGLSIDNQPAGSSTPNQRLTNDYPPNIKERRQIERERYSKRDYGTDNDQQGRPKCPCLARPMRCIRQAGVSNFPNLNDRRDERDRLSERDSGTDDDVERARRRCQCMYGMRRRTRRCDTLYDYEDYIRAGGIPLVCPHPYVSHPCLNLKKHSRCSPSGYPGLFKRVPKFPRQP